MIAFSGLNLTPAGEQRLDHAERLGEPGLGTLPLREFAVDEAGARRVYLVGPAVEGGQEERLGWYEIRVG